MNVTHITQNDLNLLPILHALMEEKNVSKAAKRLSLTQSAVSHALGRLRSALNDDLLVRGAKGMVPTPYALSIKHRITPLIASLEEFYRPSEEFDPKTANLRITIGTADYIECVLLPKLIAFLRKEAPGITIVARTAQALPKQELESGQYDLAIAGYFGELPEGYYQQKLWEDDFLSGVRRDHPGFRGKEVTAKEFASYEHVLISPQGDMKSIIDKGLEKQKVHRRIVAGTNSFLSPMWIVAESDLVITCVRRLMKSYTGLLPMRTFPCPVPIPAIQLRHVWHERTHRSPMHRWLRNAIQDIAGKI